MNSHSPIVHAALESLFGRPARSAANALPVYAVDAYGDSSPLAELSLQQPEGSYCQLSSHWPSDGSATAGKWEALPYPLYDMHPQGFLGRLLGKELHQWLNVPADPAEWDDKAICAVLARHGSGCSGNLIVGDASLLQFQTQRNSPAQALPEPGLADLYAIRANDVGRPTSLAGGEFPKFTAQRQGDGDALTPHVIVKFSGVAGGGATQRWADLLVCEQIALQHASLLEGVKSARTRVLGAAGRTFLESERFDRVGAHGRLAMVSLLPASMHLLGLGTQDWTSHAEALAQKGWLATADVQPVSRLWWYGRLIANTDMHLGNLAFFCEGGQFRLAPAFDMLPMAYAPLRGGEVPAPAPWQPPMPAPAQRDIWSEACRAALNFWDAATNDDRISEDMRSVSDQNAQLLRRAQAVL